MSHMFIGCSCCFLGRLPNPPILIVFFWEERTALMAVLRDLSNNSCRKQTPALTLWWNLNEFLLAEKMAPSGNTDYMCLRLNCSGLVAYWTAHMATIDESFDGKSSAGIFCTHQTLWSLKVLSHLRYFPSSMVVWGKSLVAREHCVLKPGEPIHCLWRTQVHIYFPDLSN